MSAPCFSPLSAWQGYDGVLYFDDPAGRRDIARKLQLRCQKCIGCRTERAEIWAARCMHEAQLYQKRTVSNNAFVTLTFKPECRPARGSLEYRSFQLFMKRLRFEYGSQHVRFYMSAEYDSAWNPHFHACLFNGSFGDQVRWSKNEWGDWVYRSPTLEKLWSFGFSTVGAVTHETARYVAGYIADKLDGEKAKEAYARVDELGPYMLRPPFSRMSNRPGIGAGWFAKYGRTDVYKGRASDGAVWQDGLILAGGRKVSTPGYYDRLLKRSDPQLLDVVKAAREMRGFEAQAKGDGTPERLAVREEVLKARLAWRKRD